MSPANQNLPTTKAGRKWKRQDYAVRKCVMEEVLKELNLDTPTRDLFASTRNSRCKEFFGEEDDAMSKSWVGCLNWCNPPFAILNQVVTKILEERPEVVIVVPDWQRGKWFQRLREVASRQTFRACGVRVFEADRKSAGQTRWGTWFFLYQSKGGEYSDGIRKATKFADPSANLWGRKGQTTQGPG